MVVKCDTREELEPVQFYIDEEISIPLAEKIISVTAGAAITSVEAMSGEAKAAYRITYKVIYKSKDGGTAAHEESFEHNDTIKSPMLSAKGTVFMRVRVVSNESVGTDKLKVRSTLALSGFYIAEANFTPLEQADNFIGKTKSVMVETIEPLKTAEIIAANEFPMNEEISEILTYNTHISLNPVSTATDICRISGDAFVYISYLSDGNLYSRCLTVPFETETLAAGIKDGDRAFCFGEEGSTTLSLDTKDGTTDLKIEVVISVNGYAVTEREVNVLVDAYSKSKELNVTYGEVSLTENVCLTDETEKFFGLIRLPEDKPGIRSVKAVCPPTIGAFSVTNMGALTVEGIVSASIIYMDEEENLQEMLCEIPYHFVLSRDFPCSDNLVGCAMVNCISARMRHNDEIDVSGEIKIEIYATTQKVLKYIENVEEGEDRETIDTAISLYIVEDGETLWDVAKALVSDEDTLMELNPELTLPLKGGENVLLYRPI